MVRARYTKEFSVRMYEDEYERLLSFADEKGLSVSAYIRLVVFGEKEWLRDDK